MGYENVYLFILMYRLLDLDDLPSARVDAVAIGQRIGEPRRDDVVGAHDRFRSYSRSASHLGRSSLMSAANRASDRTDSRNGSWRARNG
jgi:hypothetical protein